MKLIEQVNSLDTKPRPKVEIAPRLSNPSVFSIDHRGELIREMRADADILDKRAAEQTALALSLRLAADHLDANPPEP
jgi:hypothetical protein